MNQLIFRPATPQDSLKIAPLIIAAGGGIFEFLLEDFLQDTTLESLLSSEVKKEEGNLSYHNIEVAQLKDKVVGMTNTHPIEEFGVTEEIKNFIDPEKLDWLAELFMNKVEGSLFLNILSVFPDYQKQGIGTRLINNSKQKARREKFTSISLTVWTDNTEALGLYKRQGFQEVKQIQVDCHPLMPHEGGIKLMQCLV